MIEFRRAKLFHLFTSIVLGAGLPIAGFGEKLVEVNRIVAQVEDKVITQGEIDRWLDLLTLGEDEKKLRSQEFIENTIENMLVIQEFKSEGRFIPESYVEGEYNKELIRLCGNDRKLFRDFLREKSQTQLEFRRELEDKIIIGAMYAKFRRNQADVSPDRVEEYYSKNIHLFAVESKVHLREIKLAPLAGEPRDILLQQAKDICKQLKVGVPFAELATKHGQSTLKKDGGDWGVAVTKNEIAYDLLREKAFALKEGEFSEPFVLEQTRRNASGESEKTGKYAVYVLKAEQVQAAGMKSLDEVRQQVEQSLARDLDRQAKARWVARLRRKAYVKYFDDSER